MGGEPFLREDWYFVGQTISDLGMHLSIASNGLLVKKNIEKISQLEPLVIGISIDGIEQMHDTIRGKGTFGACIEAIELLREKGIGVTVITTVSKLNFKDLPKMKDLIYKKGINWQIQIAMPFGNFAPSYLLSKEEYYAVAMFIASARVKSKFSDMPVIGAHCFGYNSMFLPGCSSWNGCTAGISSIGITSDGGIVGCLSMGNQRFIEGNIRNEKLKGIWYSDSFKYNRGFEKGKLGPNCMECRYGTKCKGGCNSMSYTITNSFHNDPYCFYKIEKEMGI